MKRRHRENYVPKELRGKQEAEPEKTQEKLSDNEVKNEIVKEVEVEVVKNEDIISEENN